MGVSWRVKGLARVGGDDHRVLVGDVGNRRG